MKFIKNIFKISIVLLLLWVCIGSIYAADNNDTRLGEDDSVDDFELDEDLNDDSDDYIDDDSDYDDLDDDVDDESDDDLDLDDYEQDNISEDYKYTDFDFLKTKITFYLDRYGNYSGHNWTQSDEFLKEYQIYLANPKNYTLNESSQGYQTYLKIYDSIISTFGDYNLTENETDYLKFMVIFYLNHYGNVSANYTWNESESFSNFTFPWVILGTIIDDKAIAVNPAGHNHYLNSYNPFYHSIGNSTYVNQTSTANQTGFELQESFDFNIFMLILVIMLVILLMI